MEDLYAHPEYYELAFAYRDSAAEQRVLEACIARHGGRRVERVLEVACGHGPHAPLWLERGYGYMGLDCCAAMLARARERVGDAAGAAWIEGDLADFEAPAPADFAYVLLGSLYAPDTAALHAHYNAMARALAPGALYVLEWCVEFEPFVDMVDSWRHTYGDTVVETVYTLTHLDRLEQTVEERVEVTAHEAGGARTFATSATKRVMYPQEFLQFIGHHPAFEFVGWWNDWDLDEPLDGAHPINRPLIVIRRLP